MTAVNKIAHALPSNAAALLALLLLAIGHARCTDR
jgi:hypothetical protein